MVAVPPPLSPAATLVNGGPAKPALSSARRYSLLLLFCLAQFLDAFNNSALFSALPELKETLNMTEGEATWLISAFQLTFASFLLISGRISDVYNPKFAFIAGVEGLGVLSIAAGFMTSKIPLIVFRALSGIAAALTIPSALTLLVNAFPDPSEQARAIGIFGGCGAVGNILGLLIGAFFIQWASWRWVFWFVAIIALPVGALCAWLVPRQLRVDDGKPAGARFRSLDLGGVSILTAALILFIFGITSATSSGWGSAMCLAPLIISFFLVAAFLYWETIIPVERASVPPRTWFYPNFAILFSVALLPYFWWVTVFTVFTILWQQVYHWSVIMTAVRFIPLGVVAFAMSFSGSLQRRISPKYIILSGQIAVIAATVLLAFADRPSRYWPCAFPAFVLGSSGAMAVYTHTNIAIFRTSPAAMAGTVGAIFNGALQLGSAVGISAVTSIETSVEKRTPGGFESYDGRRTAIWFLLAVVVAQALAVAAFYRPERVSAAEEAPARVADVESGVGEERRGSCEKVSAEEPMEKDEEGLGRDV